VAGHHWASVQPVFSGDIFWLWRLSGIFLRIDKKTITPGCWKNTGSRVRERLAVTRRAYHQKKKKSPLRKCYPALPRKLRLHRISIMCSGTWGIPAAVFFKSESRQWGNLKRSF
jgi:hypothetical protein